MSTDTINQLVERLTETGPLTLERFSAQLGVTFEAGESNPFWSTYTAELPGGLFARAELRLHTSNTGALLILEPRNAPGLAQADVDTASLGEPLGMRPNPRIPPEGIESHYYRRGDARVTLQWTSTSRRLRSLVLEWEPPAAEGAPAGAATASAN
jgi:hypothetical protein